MKLITTITTLLAALFMCGCQTQSNITRTVRHADGSYESYTNNSNGYNYNPNFSGHGESISNTNYDIRSNAATAQNMNSNTNVDIVNPFVNPFSGQMPLPNGFSGQYTIR